MHDVYQISAADLAERGKDQIPEELNSAKHLIYSSPATLAFNSPGAQGFGVKRAGLSIPGSVMLVLAPGCCGRNTMALDALGYRERIFYLLQDETDIVTGRHLNKVTKAIEEMLDSLPERPSVVMVCMTCVDALLGTDMDRVCKKASDKVGLPVIPCYMYALTREGRAEPMVLVRKTLYSLLEKRQRKASTVNILGEFAPFHEDSELYPMLKAAGIRKINELSRCQDFDEYMAMSEANFNLVLNPACRMASQDIYKRLGIPPVEMTRVYQIDKIRNQYEMFFGSVLGKQIDDGAFYDRALAKVEAVASKYAGTRIAVGEWINGNPFELSLALLRYGFKVTEIYGTVTPQQFVYIRKIAALSPDTQIYSNLQPTMLYYDISETGNQLTIGQDAAFYNPDCPNVKWNDEIQPFGYDGLYRLFDAMEKALEGGR